MVATLQIDAEFRSLIPPLSLEEREQLEANIKADGIRDPLVVWKEKKILLDGHNRYEVATGNDIAFEVKEISLADRDAAKAWILRNQLGRRNIDQYTRSKLALQLKPLVAKKAIQNKRASGGDMKSQKSVPHNCVEPIETNRELAKLAGVSHETIRRVALIEEHAPEETKQQLRAGTMTINKAFKSLKKDEDEEQLEARPEERKIIGIGVARAHEAINSLMRIPKNDKLRKRGFQIVTDWIRHNS